MMIYEYHCNACKMSFEKMHVALADYDNPQPCPRCLTFAFREYSFPHISYLKMGRDSKGLPTSADKWAKMHEDEGRKSQDSLLNLKEI